jgi:hypothetical protein
VSGTGFAAGVTLTATFNSSALILGGPGAAQTDAFGSFDDATLTIPSPGAGAYTLAVTVGPGHTANSPFTVIPAAGYKDASGGLTATQQVTTMSGLVTLSGGCTNCSANETFTVYADGIAAGTVKTGNSSRWNGSAQPAFGLPASLVNGTHLVTIVDTSGKVFGTTTLTLSTFLVPSPVAGAPGTTVTVSGARHAITAGATFTTYADSISEGTGTATATGTTSSFAVPDGKGNSFTVAINQTG